MKDWDDSPYCGECGSCGEPGCCYPTKCKFVQMVEKGDYPKNMNIKAEGKYCWWNLTEYIKDLKFELEELKNGKD